MASPDRSAIDTLQMFNRATAAYIVPLLLLASNLAAYFSQDEEKPYEILGSNILLSIHLLGIYLLGQGATSPLPCKAAVRTENSESENSADEEQNNCWTFRRILALAAFFIVIAGGLKSLIGSYYDFVSVESIGPIDWSAAKVESCGYFNGNAGPNGEIHYEYHATRRYCDNADEETFIIGAINDHIKNHGAKLHCTECLDLTRGGPWNGYLLIGPSESFDHKTYCGPKLNLQTSDSGDKGGLH